MGMEEGEKKISGGGLGRGMRYGWMERGRQTRKIEINGVNIAE